MKKLMMMAVFALLAVAYTTEVSAQTNAVLEDAKYQAWRRKPVDKRKADNTKKAEKAKEVKRTVKVTHTKGEEIYTKETKISRKQTTKKKAKTTDYVGENKPSTEQKKKKNGKNFFQRLTDAGNKLGEKIGKVLNGASDAVSSRQIKNKEKAEKEQ